MVGAELKLVDVDAREWNASVSSVRDAIGPKTRAVIAIDQFGNPVQSSFCTLSIPIIEDAACALGALFGNGQPCGSLGQVSCFSFHPRKVLTTGEGGVIVTDDPDIEKRLRILRNHGQSEPGHFVEASTNYRLTDIQAALGNAQLERLHRSIEIRIHYATIIMNELEGVLEFQQSPPNATPNYQTPRCSASQRI